MVMAARVGAAIPTRDRPAQGVLHQRFKSVKVGLVIPSFDEWVSGRAQGQVWNTLIASERRQGATTLAGAQMRHGGHSAHRFLRAEGAAALAQRLPALVGRDVRGARAARDESAGGRFRADRAHGGGRAASGPGQRLWGGVGKCVPVPAAVGLAADAKAAVCGGGPQPVAGGAWMAGRGRWICCLARDSEMTGEPIVQMDLRLLRRARSRRNLCSGGSARASQ